MNSQAQQASSDQSRAGLSDPSSSPTHQERFQTNPRARRRKFVCSKPRGSPWLVGLLAGFLLLGALAPMAQAASFVVNTLADNTTTDGNCTLREAIDAANNAGNSDCGANSTGDDTITFSVSGTITLASTLPSIVSTIAAGKLTIDGTGQSITISGNNSVQVFYVNSGANLTLENLTVSNGSSTFGGGLLNDGRVTISNSTFSANSATFGGGLFNEFGTVTISNSTFSANSATFGGGLFNKSNSTMTISNSTFSGGGLLNDGTVTSGTVTISNSTFSGGSLENGTHTHMNIKNSIVASGNCANSGTFTASGVNFATGSSCAGFTQVTSSALNLGSLANNGGSTQTMALGAGSVAIDAVTDCTFLGGGTVTTDQRGTSRPQGARCDAGAYESDPARTLTIQKSGSGTGTVSDDRSLVNCGSTCSASYGNGAAVTLTATAGANSVFVGWSGDCNSSGQVTMDADKSCTATFDLGKTLTVAGAGTGLGTVTATGINCSINAGVTSGDCSETVTSGSNIVLTATPGSNSQFVSWTNCDSPSGNQCTMTLNADKTVTATFLIAGPTTYVVNSLSDNTTDDSFCTLREAIDAANDSGNGDCGANSTGDDTITFSVSGTITLASTLPSIVGAGRLTIDGTGQSITISGNSSVRVFYVNSGADLTLKNLTVINGSSGSGGLFSDSGGGLYNAGGMVTISNSTFAGNFAFGGSGGGLFNEFGTVTISNSTFAGNFAYYSGGGLRNDDTVTISNSTFSNNSAGFGVGGGLFNFGTATIKNSIVASSSGNACSGTFTVSGVNFDTDGSCSGFTHVTSAQLNLGSLANNGGPTRTMALGSGSVAIDAVTDCMDLSNNPVTTDQRGTSRPQGARCDAGAYESDPARTLTIQKSGSGTGTVSDDRSLVNCGSTCSASYGNGAAVTLTATAGANSVFVGWSGDCNSSGQVTMTAAKSCTATFNLGNRTLTVAGAGTGLGTVTATGINCSINAGMATGGCTEAYSNGTNVVLTATAGVNSQFVSWTNCDSPSGNQCTMTLNANKTVTATFNLTPPNITATKEDSNQTTGSTTIYKSGDTIKYTVVLTNTGGQAQPDNSTDEFTDTITGLLQSNAGGMTASSGTITYDSNTRTYSWNGAIPAGGSVTLTFSVRIPPGLSGMVCNQGKALVDTDLNGSNETTVLTTDPTPLAGAPTGQTCVSIAERPETYRVICPPRNCLAINEIEAQWSADRRTMGFFVQGTGIKAINVRVFSLTGKRVYASGWVENGLAWKLQSLNGRPVANGVYLYVVTVRGYDGKLLRTQVQKLVINR